MRLVRLLGVLVTAGVLAAATVVQGADGSFNAKLTGKEEVPRVDTEARGKAAFTVSEDGMTLRYRLNVSLIRNVTAAHIHRGKKGENGPPVAGIFGGPKAVGLYGGPLAEGSLNEKNLIGDYQGKSMADLVQLLNSGNAYVNVHTDQHPQGEIRGQIKK